MKHRFTYKGQNNTRLILVFTGWSTDASMFTLLKREGWDVMICWGYDDYDFRPEWVEGYTTIYLFAWSLGVFAASQALQGIELTAAFAINGTQTPVSDIYGIPVNIYEGTLRNLSPATLRKFQRRMFSSTQELATHAHLLPSEPSLNDLAHELQLVQSTLAQQKDNRPKLNWTRVYISEDDYIFPAANQKSAWKQDTGEDTQKIVMLDMPHYVDIARIVDATVHNTQTLAEYFSQSLLTYDDHAHSQNKIANRLAQLLAQIEPHHELKTLEIGVGSGLFTYQYSCLIRPRHADFIDLYPVPRFNIAPYERYFTGDAEVWLANADEKWDYILSASTIQWFANTRKFFADAAAHLQDNGVLVCSSFLPGNLQELDGLRPTPLIYHSESRLREWLSEYFDEVEIFSEEIRIKFPSAREALLHLKYTGVSGTSMLGKERGSFLTSLPRDEEGDYCLTYKPVYILAASPKR